MPSDNREHIDEVLADRNRGDKRVPTPIVEGTGKRDGGNFSHRGQDEKDITIGEATNFQTGIVTPDIEEESNIEGTRRTLDRDIAELEKATGAVKDELEAQIAGKYKPQNIHHGQKKETRQSDLLESEAEKVKANRSEFSDAIEYNDEYSGTDNMMPSDEERGDIDLENDPRVARSPKGDTYGGAGKRPSSSSEDGKKRTPRVQRHTYPDRKPYDWEEEAEKLKARIDDVFDSDKRNRKDLEQDTIGRVGVTDIADGKQIVSLGGGRSGGSWSKEIDPKKEDVFQTAEDLRREGKRATKLTGDDYDVKPQSRKFMRRKLQEGKDKKIKEGLEALKSLIQERKDSLKPSRGQLREGNKPKEDEYKQGRSDARNPFDGSRISDWEFREELPNEFQTQSTNARSRRDKIPNKEEVHRKHDLEGNNKPFFASGDYDKERDPIKIGHSKTERDNMGSTEKIKPASNITESPSARRRHWISHEEASKLKSLTEEQKKEIDKLQKEGKYFSAALASAAAKTSARRKLKSLTMELKDEKQEKFPTEEEIREEKHEAAKKRKKEIWDKARREGIGMSWDHKLDKASDTMDKVRKRIKRLRDLAVEDYKRSHPLEKTSTPVDRHSAKERNDPQQLREMQEERRAKRSNVGAKGREARRQKLVGKLPDLDDVEKSAKGKVTSWNRMDSGVRNEHRNTLGLSSIGDYDSLSPADRKKVKDAGFWRENIKEQPIKEGTHFGDTGSTPKLEQEKKTPTPKAKPTTGKGYSRTRAGSRKLKMASLTTKLKLAQASLDTERVQHTGKPIKTEPIRSNAPRGNKPIKRLSSSTGRDLSQDLRGDETLPQKEKPKGTLPKEPESRAATQATGQGKTQQMESQDKLNLINPQGESKPDKKTEWNPITRKPSEKKPKSKKRESVRSKLGKLRSQAEGFFGGNNEKDSPWSEGGAKQDKKIGGHKEDTTSQSHQYHGDRKQPVREEPKTPSGGRAPHTRTDYDDPLSAPRHDSEEGDGKQGGSWSQADDSSGQKGNKKQTYTRTRAGGRGSGAETKEEKTGKEHKRTRAGERGTSAEENKEKLSRTRAGARGTKEKPKWKRTRAGERDD
jgi:hypothetical protein